MAPKTAGRAHNAKFTESQIAEQQAYVYQQRLVGRSLDAIVTSNPWGLSKGTVVARVRAGIDELVLPLAEEVRKVELDRLDRWLSKLEERLETGGEPEKVIPVCVKVSERRCKLMGADAPERVEATVTEVTQDDLEFAELVREARAKAAVAEQSIREAR